MDPIVLRKGNNMSVYPIIQKGDEYVERLSGTCAETTLKAKTRRWKMLSRLLIGLKERGSITTLSPAKISAEDVRTIIVALKEKQNSSSDLRHNVSLLKEVFMYAGSTAVSTCLVQNPGLIQKTSWDRLPPLPEFVFEAFMESWKTADQKSFAVVRAYALVALFAGTGARTKEVCGADVTDLDLEGRLFTIRHPKGEGTYGRARTVVIFPEVVPIIGRYLEMRSAWLVMHQAVSQSLFFSMDGKDYGHMSENSARKLKSHIEETLGVKFELRDCRRRYAQNFVDRKLSIEEVSLLLGHRSTRTTELAYGRKKETVAIADALQITEESEDPEATEDP